jgi:hypothetical protein
MREWERDGGKRERERERERGRGGGVNMVVFLHYIS